MYRVQMIPRSFIPYASYRANGAISSSPVVRSYSEHTDDTVHVPKENKGKQVSRVPPVIQGIQPTSREMTPNESRDVLLQAQAFLKNQQDRSQLLRNKMQNVNQGAACRELHTTAPDNFEHSDCDLSHHKDNVVCGTAETWDDEMACVLQGSCLPGSTKYCRTKSMFGKMALADILQGSGMANNTRHYSTGPSSSFAPIRKLHNRPSHSHGRTYEAWDEDVATFTSGNKGTMNQFHDVPNIDRATRHYYHTEPRSQFVEARRTFGDTKRSFHTGDIVRASAKSGRTFETWDEDVAHMLHNLPSKPVFGRPPSDIRPASESLNTKYVPWY
ncbi:uncharacterized protein LOC144437151 isoform X2 [Glandiceps talaboti]